MVQNGNAKVSSARVVKLQAVATFLTGVNITRLRDASISSSLQAIGKNDLLFIHGSGELRFATAAQEGTLLTANITKVFCGSKLDPGYLLYLFTHSPFVKRQLEGGAKEGSATKRVPLSTLKNIAIPLLPQAKQKHIGDAAIQILRLKKLHQDAANLTEKLFASALSLEDWNK